MASGKILLERAKKIGLRQAEVARQAGLDVQTVNQLGIDRPRGAVSSTTEKVEQVITDHEIAVLDHLLPIHLDKRVDRVAAMLRAYGYRVVKDAA